MRMPWTSGSLRWPARYASTIHALASNAAPTRWLRSRPGPTDCAVAADSVTAPLEKRPAATPVVIHVIAEQSMIDSSSSSGATASEVCADGLGSTELIAELAAEAKLVPLVHPVDAAPEPGYAPSKKLADFVRCRDLTCRWPGCDRPAFDCDIYDTVPYADGGPTHTSNLKCYCRTHHLVKTFWGWRDQQLPDGTIILNSPAGRNLRHHTRQCAALPKPVRADWQLGGTRSRLADRVLR